MSVARKKVAPNGRHQGFFRDKESASADVSAFSTSASRRTAVQSRKIVAKGIVIGRHMVGEGSVKTLLYTDALGLIWGLSQSARAERSQLRAHLQEGTRGTFSLLKGRDVWRITGATDTVNAHFSFSDNTEAQKASARVVGFVRQFVRGEGTDPYFFQTLWGFLEALPHEDAETLRSAECVAVLRMLAALGYVEGDERVSPFLSLSYDVPLLAEATRIRSALIKVINEGMHASGLSR